MFSLLRSLWEVFRHAFHRRITVQYPEQKPYLAPRYRGRIILTRDPEALAILLRCGRRVVFATLDLTAQALTTTYERAVNGWAKLRSALPSTQIQSRNWQPKSERRIHVRA